MKTITLKNIDLDISVYDSTDSIDLNIHNISKKNYSKLRKLDNPNILHTKLKDVKNGVNCIVSKIKSELVFYNSI